MKLDDGKAEEPAPREKRERESRRPRRREDEAPQSGSERRERPRRRREDEAPQSGSERRERPPKRKLRDMFQEWESQAAVQEFDQQPSFSKKKPRKK